MPNRGRPSRVSPEIQQLILAASGTYRERAKHFGIPEWQVGQICRAAGGVRQEKIKHRPKIERWCGQCGAIVTVDECIIHPLAELRAKPIRAAQKDSLIGAIADRIFDTVQTGRIFKKRLSTT